MHDRQKVHETVVVDGIRHPIGSIVVVSAPVDASVIDVSEELKNEFPHVVGGGQAVAAPSHIIRAEGRLEPVPRVTDERDPTARQIRVEFGDGREPAVRAVEELLLDDGPGEAHARRGSDVRGGDSR